MSREYAFVSTVFITAKQPPAPSFPHQLREHSTWGEHEAVREVLGRPTGQSFAGSGSLYVFMKTSSTRDTNFGNMR